MLHLPNRLTWPRTDVATQPPKVLLLDDSRAQRMLLRALLRRWGHEVVECATPEAALAAVQRVCATDSELAELWAEAEDPEWEQTVANLTTRLGHLV